MNQRKKKKIEVLWVDKYGREHSTVVSAYSESEAEFKVSRMKKTYKSTLATGHI